MINEIIYILLSELGLTLDSNFNIVEQNTGTVLQFNSKFIKFSYQGPFMIDGQESVWFDPINSEEIASKFYNYYTKVLYDSEAIRILHINEVQSVSDTRKCIQVTYIENEEKLEYETNYYNNLALAYLEIIFNFSRNDITPIINLDRI